MTNFNGGYDNQNNQHRQLQNRGQARRQINAAGGNGPTSDHPSEKDGTNNYAHLAYHVEKYQEG